MSNRNKGNFVDNIGRQTWDLEKYEALAKEEREQEDRPIKQTGIRPGGVQVLESHTKTLNFEKNLGRVMAIGEGKSKRPGFYCEVCDALLMDSVAYMKHINGRKHQKALGKSMFVQRKTASQVLNKIQELASKVPSTAYTRTTMKEKLAMLEERENPGSVSEKSKPKLHRHIIDEDISPDDEDDDVVIKRTKYNEEEMQRILQEASDRAQEYGDVDVHDQGERNMQYEVIMGDEEDDLFDEDEESDQDDVLNRLAALKQ